MWSCDAVVSGVPPQIRESQSAATSDVVVVRSALLAAICWRTDRTCSDSRMMTRWLCFLRALLTPYGSLRTPRERANSVQWGGRHGLLCVRPPRQKIFSTSAWPSSPKQTPYYCMFASCSASSTSVPLAILTLVQSMQSFVKSSSEKCTRKVHALLHVDRNHCAVLTAACGPSVVQQCP